MKTAQLTFTRFLAAIAIVIFHFGGDVIPFNRGPLYVLFRQANVGVSYFFILSGFVMVIAHRHQAKIDLIQYLRNRFARIYPLYLLAIISLLGFFLLFSSVAMIDKRGLVVNLLMIQAWIPGKALSFNTPGWSLSVELFFYFLFPFLYNFIYTVYKSRGLIIPFILFWLVSQIVLHQYVSSGYYHPYPSKSHDFIYYFPLMHLNEFLIGNLAGLMFTGKTAKYNTLIVGIFIAFVVALTYHTRFIFHNGMLAVFFAPLIFLLAANTGIITNIFRKKALVFLGEISYGIYILQLPVFLVVQKLLDHFHITGSDLRFYAFFIALIIASAISHVFIEVPLRNKIKEMRLSPPRL